MEVNGETEAETRYTKSGEKGQLGKANSKSSRKRTTLQQFPMGRSRCQGEKLNLLVFRGDGQRQLQQNSKDLSYTQYPLKS